MPTRPDARSAALPKREIVRKVVAARTALQPRRLIILKKFAYVHEVKLKWFYFGRWAFINNPGSWYRFQIQSDLD